jgi:hypothetical protein
MTWSAPSPWRLPRVKPPNADLKLEKTKDLASQLSSIEWAMSIPGTPEQKDRFIYQTGNCAYCHNWERIMKSQHTADEFLPLITRMQSYYTDGQRPATMTIAAAVRSARPTRLPLRRRIRCGAASPTGSRRRTLPSSSPP